MRADPAGSFSGAQRPPHVAASVSSKRPPRRRVGQLNSAYIVAIALGAASLFFVLVWVFTSFGNEDSALIPSLLSGSVVLVLVLGGREIVVRRGKAYRLQKAERRDKAASDSGAHPVSTARTAVRNAAALKALQKQSTEADGSSNPDLHLRTYHVCSDYLESTEELLRTGEISREGRVALRSGQERVRGLQRHHMLSWARLASLALTQDAQQKFRLSDKVETAQRGIRMIESAQALYPDEAELSNSLAALNEFIASAKVAHWVELAERSTFRGHYRRAIDRYRDALFYLSRESMGDELRHDLCEKILREIELLRTQIHVAGEDCGDGTGPSRSKSSGARSV